MRRMGLGCQGLAGPPQPRVSGLSDL